jgi:hypothetical protein
MDDNQNQTVLKTRPPDSSLDKIRPPVKPHEKPSVLKHFQMLWDRNVHTSPQKQTSTRIIVNGCLLFLLPRTGYPSVQ